MVARVVVTALQNLVVAVVVVVVGIAVEVVWKTRQRVVGAVLGGIVNTPLFSISIVSRNMQV